MMVSFCAVRFPMRSAISAYCTNHYQTSNIRRRGVLDEILNLIESVSEGFSSYSCREYVHQGNRILIQVIIAELYLLK